MRVSIRVPRLGLPRPGRALAVLALAALAAWIVPRWWDGRRSGRLDHEAYVVAPWGDGLSEAAPRLSRAMVVAGEVGWAGGRPTVARVPLDWRTLARARVPVGLVVEVADPRGGAVLPNLLRGMLLDARSGGLRAEEVQLSFADGPARPDDVRALLASVREVVAPAELTLAAPMAWLDRPGFERIVGAAGGFVVRFGPAPPDPVAARAAVEKAALAGLPFRVALPTYTLVERLDGRGGVVGRSTDGVPLTWPAHGRIRATAPDPRALASLLRGWEQDRPGSMEGVVWDRLPVARDARTLSWPTLQAVMDGRAHS